MKIPFVTLILLLSSPALSNAVDFHPSKDYRIQAESLGGIQKTVFGPTEAILVSENDKLHLVIAVSPLKTSSALISLNVLLFDSKGKKLELTSPTTEGFDTVSTGVAETANRQYTIEHKTLTSPLQVILTASGNTYRFWLSSNKVEQGAAANP